MYGSRRTDDTGRSGLRNAFSQGLTSHTHIYIHRKYYCPQYLKQVIPQKLQLSKRQLLQLKQVFKACFMHDDHHILN